MIEPRSEFLDELEAKLRASHRSLQRHRTIPWRAAAGFIMVLFAASMVIPSVRSFAQGAVDDLFKRSESDILQPGNLAIYTEIQKFDSIEDAHAATTMEIKVPAAIPPGFELDTLAVSADGMTVTQQYKRAGRFLIITQTINDPSESDGLIGPAAEIVPVTINGIDGAYVEGVWGGTNPGDDLTWIADASFRRLRWIDGDVRYEIASMGGAPDGPYYLSMEEMIELAESME